jgi:hypothetical protein
VKINVDTAMISWRGMVERFVSDGRNCVADALTNEYVVNTSGSPENGLILRSVTTEVTSGLRLYPGSYELRVTRTSGFRCENIELWEKV